MKQHVKIAAVAALFVLGAVQTKADQTNLVQDLSIRLDGITQGSTVTTRKRRSGSPVSSLPSKRIKSTVDDSSPSRSEPTTPDQPTHPSNPDFTGSSTASKDEENTKKLLFDLLRDTMSVLEEDFRNLAWQRSGYWVELSQTLS